MSVTPSPQKINCENQKCLQTLPDVCGGASGSGGESLRHEKSEPLSLMETVLCNQMRILELQYAKRPFSSIAEFWS